MKKFSDISNTLETSKDSFIKSFVDKSGLPKQMVTKLYENYELGGIEPTSKLLSMLPIKVEDSSDIVSQLLDMLKNTDKNQIQKELLRILNTKAESDSIIFFRMVMWILMVKDQNNFLEIAKTIDMDGKYFDDYVLNINLFESVGIPVEDSDVNSTKIPVILGLNDGCEINEDIEFYGNLKTILSRNNKRWGYNRHLDNVYNKIWEYLDAEIEYLTNKDLVTSSDDRYYDIILQDLMYGELNPMYRDINTLRPLISDIQTFNYDLMLMIVYWVKSNQHLAQYISRREYDGFINATTQLYSQISSSEKVSKLTPKNTIYDCGGTKNGLEIWKKLVVDYDYDFNTRPLKVSSIVDMLYIIKSCSVDYNLQIRPYLRNFVTNGLNIVAKLERLIIEHNKINKFKN